MDDTEIYEEIVRLNRAGVASALATVVESAGSSPRKAGAKMLVKYDGSIMGTVGGGKVELEVIASARQAMASGLPLTMPFNLTEEHGHVCGGRLLVYIEPSDIPPRLIVIGAGHVGRALTDAAKVVRFHVTVADERPEYATRERMPGADEVMVADYAGMQGLPAVDAGTFIVITTTGFEKDFAAIRAALKTPARYIGVIGSARKRDVMFKTLAGEGFSQEELGRITIPVGLAIGAETPEEIAVSIVAQLIETRRGNAAAGLGPSTCGGDVSPDGKMQAASPAR